MTETKNFLGIDYGDSKIGLALADKETEVAFAFDILKNNKEIVASLKRIIKDHQITTIIIGVASHFNDKGNSSKARSFAEKIEKETGIKVEYQEEMFTTKIAQRNMIESSGKGSSLDDSEAARIILQDWLDSGK